MRLLIEYDYDDTTIHGVIPDTPEGDDFVRRLSARNSGLTIETVGALTDLTTYEGTLLTLSLRLWWNGRIQREGRWLNEWVALTDPGPREHLYRIKAFEEEYTLGVEVFVQGDDLERVEREYAEARTRLTADPEASVREAWQGGNIAWLLHRPENAGFRL